MERKETFSAFLKKRLVKGLGLREFARIIDMQPSNYCCVESGSLPPPSNKLDVMASTLGIKNGSSDYYRFMDLASETRDEIPLTLESLSNLILLYQQCCAQLRIRN